MTNRVYTASEIWSWGPCARYTREDIDRLVGDGLTALQITLRRDVPIEDRIWAVLRPPVFDARALTHLSCDFASRYLRHKRRRGIEPDPRSWEAVRVMRLYADGSATCADVDTARASTSPVRDAEIALRDAIERLLSPQVADLTSYASASDGERAAWLEANRDRVLFGAPSGGSSAGADDTAELRWQLAHIRRALLGQLAWQKGTQQ